MTSEAPAETRRRNRGGPPWGGPPWSGDGGWRQPGGHMFRDGPPWGRGDGGGGNHAAGWIARSAFALVLFWIEWGGSKIAAWHQPEARPLDHLAFFLVLAGVVVMPARIRWRVVTCAITVGTTVAYLTLGYPYGPVEIAALIAVIGAVRHGHRVAVWIMMGLSWAVFVFAWRFLPQVGGVHLRQPGLGAAVSSALWIILGLFIAEMLRVRREHFIEMRRAGIEQARSRAEQERRQASEERLRIAQELHDVLGHHLTLINVQAGVGLHLMAEQPEQARIALETIKKASAEALGEVRGVLSALRPKDERAPRAPGPSLCDVASLIDPADTEVTGESRTLPADVDRAAYRIVQESLTNVRRHAGEGARAKVTIGYAPDRLTLRIADNGVGPGASTAPGADSGTGGGTGIAGMRTRAEALGGTLTTGAGKDAGFVVTASLPLPPAGAGTDEDGVR